MSIDRPDIPQSLLTDVVDGELFPDISLGDAPGPSSVSSEPAAAPVAGGAK